MLHSDKTSPRRSARERTRRLWTRQAGRSDGGMWIVALCISAFLLSVTVIHVAFKSGQHFDRGVGFGVGLLMICLVGVIDNFCMKSERLWRRKRLRLTARMHFRHRGEAETCPYCREPIDAGPPITCSGCEVVYHRACRDELLGGCGTIGCSEQGRRLRLRHPKTLKA